MTVAARLALVIGLAASAICGACSGGTTVDTPRLYAWPRAEILPAEYRSVTLNGMTFDINTRARIDTVRDGLNIVYPGYGAIVYLSAVDGISDFARAYSLRLDRIERNLATDNADVTTVDNGYGFESVTVVARAATQTPVQLLAGNASNRALLTATAFFNTPVTPTTLDSVAPYIDALSRDMTHMAETLRMP